MKVFISHSHRDRAAANRIARELSARGIEPWLDIEQIAPGEVLVDRVTQEIEDADAVLIVISSNTDESRFQTSEIAFAVAAHRRNPAKRIFPVLVDQKAAVPFFIRDIAYCDLSSDDKYDNNFKSLVEVLLRPRSPQPNLDKLDKRKLEAIEAEREMLKQKTDDFLKEKISREKKTFLIINIGVAITVIGAVFVLWIFGMFKTPDNAHGGSRNSFIAGAISGVLCSFVAGVIYWAVKKLSAHKEVDDADR